MSIDNQKQFEIMQDIGAIVANCLEYLKSKSRAGITTLELDHLAGKYLSEHGAVSAPKSEYDFPGFACFSVEHEVAHGVPSDRVLKDGDLLNIDVSASKNGLFADNGESFVIGGIKNKKSKLCYHVGKVLDLALAGAKAGSNINNVGLTVEQYAKKNKLTVIHDLGGHGVGKSLHEEPSFIGSFYDPSDKRKFEENMLVAIEPFISNGAHHIEEADDEWTLYHDNFYSVQKEHTVMIRKGKPFIFTKPTKRF